MIQTVRIKSFKSLEKVDVDLGLVNVFIGANGSGKSNLLEAIGVLGAAANGRVDDESLLRRGVRPGVPALYKSSFKGTRQPIAIQFEASSGGASFAVGLFNPLEKPEPAWRFRTEQLKSGLETIVGRSPASRLVLEPTSGLTALKAVEIAQDSAAGRLLSDLRNFAIYSPNTVTLRGLDLDPQSRDPIGLNGGRLAEAVRTLISIYSRDEQVYQALASGLSLIEWANSVAATSPEMVPVSKTIPQSTRILRFRDRYMVEGRNMLSGYDASEGALYVLFMIAIVHHPDTPRVLAVDNFDHALNPRLAKALTRRICEWTIARGDRQLFLTSHNPLVLDGLPLRDDRVRLFTVERSRKGKTVVKRVEVSEELLAAADKGLPLSQQWVMGTLGGVPNI